jgi:tetratricopeptide (TPR) repeat protein
MGDVVSFHLGPRHGMRRATSALAWYERGCQLEGSDPEQAIAAYRRALAGRPDLADAHNNLGRLLHDRGELVEAEVCYRRALVHESGASAGSGLYHFNLGVVLEDRGAIDEAIEAYERALALDGTLADAHFNLARQIERRARSAGDELMLRRAVRHLARYRDLSRVG